MKIHLKRFDLRKANAFTLIELLTVIAVMGLLAALLVGLAPAAARKKKEAQIKTELAQLVTAIESYKAQFGYYPPDNSQVSGGATNVFWGTNQLFYELTGTVVNNANGTFSSPSSATELSSAAIQTLFHTGGFVNASEDAGSVKNFLTVLRESQYKTVTVGNYSILVLAVPVVRKPTDPSGPAFPLQPQVIPWRYNSSAPLHNRNGGFDLWAEVYFGNTPHVFGNWKD